MASLLFLCDMMGHRDEFKKRVVSMEECQAIAGRLKMDRTDSGGYLDPLQPDEPVHVHATDPPRGSVPGPSDAAGQRESNHAAQLPRGVWSNCGAESKRVSAVEGKGW